MYIVVRVRFLLHRDIGQMNKHVVKIAYNVAEGVGEVASEHLEKEVGGMGLSTRVVNIAANNAI